MIIHGIIKLYRYIALKTIVPFRIIRNKYIKTNYSFRFINSVIDGLHQENEDPLIPASFSRKEKKLASKFLFGNETKMRFLVLLTNWKRLLTVK